MHLFPKILAFFYAYDKKQVFGVMIFLYVHVLSQNGFKKRNYVMKINIVMNPAFHQNSFKMHKKWINSLIKKKIKIDYLRVKIKT